MQRSQRIRKPNSRYDPNVYVLASFPKKKKHTIIPKHQVTIDVVDEHNGIVRSSGFPQPIRIIAEGSRDKCREKASQFTRDTGSEEIDINPGDDNEDKSIDNNYIYGTQDLYNNNNDQYSPITTNTRLPDAIEESGLDFSLVNSYNNSTKTMKSNVLEDDDHNNTELENYTQVNQNENDAVKRTSFSVNSSPKPLVIDEHSSIQQFNHDSNIQQIDQNDSSLQQIDQDDSSLQQIDQTNSRVHSNAMDELSNSSEREDEEENMPRSKRKSTKKKTCGVRSKKTTSNSTTDAAVDIENLQKEFSLYQFKVDNRLKALEKTFRILKNRKILRENKNLSNIVNSATSQPTPTPEPEFVLGVDISSFSFGFDEHTRLIRQIFRATGYASNPNAVLGDEEKVTELKNLMKKRDKTLQADEEALTEAWQIVKESVRQLKHDHKRNKIFKTIKTSCINTNTNTSSLNDTENNTDNMIVD